MKEKSADEMVRFIYHKFLIYKTNSDTVELACKKCTDKFGWLGLLIGYSIIDKIKSLGEGKIREMYLKLQDKNKIEYFDEIELK